MRKNINTKKLKGKGFTLVEAIVSSSLFLLGVIIISQTYMAIVKSVILAQSLQANIDNVRFGLEKIWNEVKAGSNFPTTTIMTTTLNFLDRRCELVKIFRQDNSLKFERQTVTSDIFDKNLVQVNDFKVFFDTSSDPNTSIYSIYSKKVVYIDLDLSLKAGEQIIPFKINLTVAPYKSPLSDYPPCQ